MYNSDQKRYPPQQQQYKQQSYNQLRSELLEEQEKVLKLTLKLQVQEKLIEEKDLMIQSLQEQCKQLQNLQRKSSSQKFTSTMDQIPEFEESIKNIQVQENRKSTDSLNDDQEQNNEQKNNVNTLQNQSSSNSEKKKSLSHINNEEINYPYKRRKSIALNESLTSDGSPKNNNNNQNQDLETQSQNIIGSNNQEELQSEDIQIIKQKSMSVPNSKFQQQAILEPNKNNIDINNIPTVNEEVYQQQKQDIRSKQSTNYQDLEEEKQDIVEIQPDINIGQNRKQSTKYTLNTEQNNTNSANNLGSDSSQGAQVRIKSPSYYQRDLSSNYLNALKKGIVALSYDVEEDEQQQQAQIGSIDIEKISTQNEDSNRMGVSPSNKQQPEPKDDQQKRHSVDMEIEQGDVLYEINKIRKSQSCQKSANNQVMFKFNKKQKSQKNIHLHQTNVTERQENGENLKKIDFPTQRLSLDQTPSRRFNRQDSSLSGQSPITPNQKLSRHTSSNEKSFKRSKTKRSTSITKFESPQYIKNQQQQDGDKLDNLENHSPLIKIQRCKSSDNLDEEKEQELSIDKDIYQNQQEDFNLNQDGQEQGEQINIFENFFMIGSDRQELSEISENSDVKEAILPAKILYSYPPVDPENPSPVSQIIHDFAFPFGVDAMKYPDRSSVPQRIKEEVIIKGSKENEMKQKQRYFYFTIRNDAEALIQYQNNGDAQQQTQNQKLSSSINPSKVFFCICLRVVDFIEDTKHTFSENQLENSKQRQFWRMNKVYCFVTKYPFYPLFQNFLFQIISDIKLERMNVLAQLDIKQPGSLQQIDSDWIIPVLDRQIKPLLQKIQHSFVPKFDEVQKLPGVYGATTQFQIPKEKNCFIQLRLWSIVPTLSNLTVEDFLHIYFSILQEKTIIFVSKSQALLTYTIHTFETFLYPFQWPHPIIYMIPENLLEILESPVPLLLGINQTKNFIKNEGYEQKYSNYIYVYLDDHISDSIVVDQNQQLHYPDFNNFIQKLIMNYFIINEYAQEKYYQKQQQQEGKKSFLHKFFDNIRDSSPRKSKHGNNSSNNNSLNMQKSVLLNNQQNSQNKSRDNEKYIQQSQHTRSLHLTTESIQQQHLQLQKQQHSSIAGRQNYSQNIQKVQKFIAKENEESAAELIAHLIKDTIQNQIINLIPKHLKYTEDQLIDLEYLTEQMCHKQCEKDTQFLKCFCKTTIFTNFLDNINNQ